LSATAVVPPPSSSSLLRHVPRLTARARALLTAVNLHYAAVTALLVLALYMVAHLLFVSESLRTHNADALNEQRVLLTKAQLQAKPLRGLDTKLVDSTAAADAFYADRLPYAYSQVVAELGVVQQHAGVRLMNVQYAQSPVLAGAKALTEVRMDASLSGEYRPVVEFVNGLERDHMFFLVNGINLTGQQNGMVNLRIRITTYLRAPNEKEAATGIPADVATSAAMSGGAQ
jgi:type IV pilus assembly protein PilO